MGRKSDAQLLRKAVCLMWKIFDKTDVQAVQAMESFVRTHENCHFLQMPSWAEVKTFWRWRGIAVYRKGLQVAAMGVLIRPLPLGFSLLYAPRGPVCDRNDGEIWKELMDGLKKLAKQVRAVALYMDPDEDADNTRFRSRMAELGFSEKSDDGFGNIQPQHVFRLHLEGKDENEIFQAFTQKTRYNIGLSKRKGVSVRCYCGSERIPDFIIQNFQRLMETTGERDHFSVRSAEYFRILLTALQDDAKIFVAYSQGKPIAGAIEVFCGSKAWYLYGASANEMRNTMPNYLLQWTMIRQALERGCKLYDFRGVPGNPGADHPLYGLYRFKKGFSGTYTKFTGMFIYTFRPLPAKVFQLARQARTKLRT